MALFARRANRRLHYSRIIAGIAIAILLVISLRGPTPPDEEPDAFRPIGHPITDTVDIPVEVAVEIPPPDPAPERVEPPSAPPDPVADVEPPVESPMTETSLVVAAVTEEEPLVPLDLDFLDAGPMPKWTTLEESLALLEKAKEKEEPKEPPADESAAITTTEVTSASEPAITPTDIPPPTESGVNSTDSPPVDGSAGPTTEQDTVSLEDGESPTPPTPSEPKEPPGPPPPSKKVVVASLAKDDTSWLDNNEAIPWEVVKYVADNPEAEHTVPQNKGGEGMVYLTYIIDSYDNLPDYMVFIHGERYQWHNDDPLYDTVPLLQFLRIRHLNAVGYANLRCVWTLGCPATLKIDSNGTVIHGYLPRPAQDAFPEAFQQLFPNASLPSEVGAPIGGQFAVSRAQVLQRPLADYVRYRQWLLDTPLSDEISGQILDQLWHMVFGKPAVSCLQAQSCYCKMWGLCFVRCESAGGTCGSMWLNPPSRVLPEGWPAVGWDGMARSERVLKDLREMAGSSKKQPEPPEGLDL